VSRAVLDASAMLAMLFNEKGAAFVRDRSFGGLISAVNYSEVLLKLIDRTLGLEEAEHVIRKLTLEIVPFDRETAAIAASFRSKTRDLGMSFADRAALALAAVTGLPVPTGDQKWKKASVGVTIELIR